MERRFCIRPYIYCLTVLALLLQGLIPQGFMPAPGKVRIEICTGMGMATVAVDAGKAPVRHGGKSDACPFAPVLGYSFVAAQGFFMVAAVATALLHFTAFVFPRNFFKPYFSQGPPLS